MLALWLAAACVLLACLRRYMTARPPGFPPGPPRLPFWGSYWFLFLANYRYTYKALSAWGRLYRTNVLGLHIGPFPAVALLDYTAIKEVFDNPDCQGRLDGFLVRERAMKQRLGLFFTDGEQWKSQRRFMLKNMRDLGYARRSPVFEDVVSQEVRDLLDLINGDRKDEVVFADGCLNLPKALCVGGANMLCHVIFGDRFPPAEHHRLYKLADMCCLAVKEVEVTGGTVTLTPWLRHFTPKQFGYKGFVRGTGFATDFFRVALEEHKAIADTSDDDNLRDFIDFYLNKLKQKESNETNNFFKEDELLMVATDLMLPTIATMASLMSYILLQLMHNPDVLAAAQKSLDATVGKDRLPTLDDRQRLPYIEAIIREGLRHQSSVPISVPRRTTAATTIQGYPIPENTAIVPVLWSANRDPNMWDEPDAFRPERFLDKEGKLIKDKTLPFGGGKRLCVGETFTRHHVFLFLSALLQSCEFSPPPRAALPDPEEHVITGFSNTPPDFRLCVARRT
ncbi:probable cytochrome P450 304a1 [Bacillus rossius redtenbacheri]|uniref:probable cytochrome P450 304a1 n=1 Tax=Bacillus rossius redtenbacheri TaxID=93214 RepID=UPI002FDD0239